MNFQGNPGGNGNSSRRETLKISEKQPGYMGLSGVSSDISTVISAKIS